MPNKITGKKFNCYFKLKLQLAGLVVTYLPSASQPFEKPSTNQQTFIKFLAIFHFHLLCFQYPLLLRCSFIQSFRTLPVFHVSHFIRFFFLFLSNSFLQRNLSNQSHVVLLAVPLNISGKFTCEISVEAPSFQTAMVSGEMEVVGEYTWPSQTKKRATNPFRCYQCLILLRLEIANVGTKDVKHLCS